jgi:uncharacterized Fe-S cluster-containing radical SAM superfamily enzyme
MKKIIITESQIKRVIDNLINEGHNDKELRKLISWAKNKLNCTDTDTKNGGRLCPPKDKSEDCYTYHHTDKAVEPVKVFLARAYGVTKKEVHDAFKENRAIRKDGDS